MRQFYLILDLRMLGDGTRTMELSGQWYTDCTNTDDFVYFVDTPGDRPPFWTIPAFVWGRDHNIDTDGDSNPADSVVWTELDARSREGAGAFSVLPFQERPLILVVVSSDRFLAARAAYILAHHVGGAIRRCGENQRIMPEDFIPDLGDDFDLAQAMSRFREAMP